MHTPPHSSARPVICKVPSCGRKVSAKALCKAHYARQQRGKDLHTPILAVPKRDPVCSVNNTDCSEGGKHYGLGFCRFHWRRAKQYGDPLASKAAPNHGMTDTPTYISWIG